MGRIMRGGGSVQRAACLSTLAVSVESLDCVPFFYCGVALHRGALGKKLSGRYEVEGSSDEFTWR